MTAYLFYVAIVAYVVSAVINVRGTRLARKARADFDTAVAEFEVARKVFQENAEARAATLGALIEDLTRRLATGQILVTSDDGTVGKLAIVPDGEENLRLYVEPVTPDAHVH